MLFRTKRDTLLVEQVNAAERRISELIEQQRHLREALVKQQAQADRERVALCESFTSHISEMHELIPLQRNQQESVVALVNETHHQLDRLRADLTISMQCIEQIEANVAQLATRTQALEELALGWQQRTDTYEHQIAALHTRLQEEARAREVLAQQVAGSAAHKATQRQRKSVRSNGATMHTQP